VSLQNQHESCLTTPPFGHPSCSSLFRRDAYLPDSSFPQRARFPVASLKTSRRNVLCPLAIMYMKVGSQSFVRSRHAWPGRSIKGHISSTDTSILPLCCVAGLHYVNGFLRGAEQESLDCILSD